MITTPDRSTPAGCDPASVREWREKRFDRTLLDEIRAYLALSDDELLDAGLTRAFLLDELASTTPATPAPLRS